GFAGVGQARDGGEAGAKIESMRPAIAVVDLHMPKLSGVDVARRAPAGTAVILYTAHADRALMTEAVDAGARAYVLKEAPLSDLRRAIETVAAGGTYVDAVLAGALASAASDAKLHAITQREREV